MDWSILALNSGRPYSAPSEVRMTTPKQLPATVECVWPARAILGEGPCWDTRSNHLSWVDIKGKQLHRYNPEDQSKHSWELPYRLCSVDVPPDNWLVANSPSGFTLVGCGDQGFGWLKLTDNDIAFHAISHPEQDQPGNRFNDGKVGPDGRYWAGTMHDHETEVTGKLYALDPTGGITVLDDGYFVPNGPAFGRNRSTAYHTDSARQVIYVFELTDDGQLLNKREFIRFSPGEGYPDGMTVDHDDNLWITFWDGARIEKIAPSGERLGQVALPVERPTSCIFADPQCRLMYVTSAGIDAAPDEILAGGLFSILLH